MRQEAFERAREARWREFDALLAALERRQRVDVSRFASLYRGVCQDLALARERVFSATLAERLNALALRGHDQLYRSRQSDARLLGWLRELPGALRSLRASLLGISLLFALSAGLAGYATARDPGLLYAWWPADQIARYEAMYDPDRSREGVRVQERAQMFGFYVWNNVSIAFRAFASGLLFGLGAIFFVVFNGLHLGALSGYLTAADRFEPLARFAVGHGAFELPALLLAAAAGARVGLGLLAPGSRSRRSALRTRAREVLPAVYAAGAMLVIAAAIEAFWSPLPLPPALLYSVGAALWAVVLFGFVALGGRRAA